MTEVLSKELWKRITDLTQSMLEKKDLHYDFNPPKYDGSYVKTKSFSGVCFTFALNDREVWIELEIKAKKGEPQESVYNQIHAKSIEIEKKLGYKIRWDREDRIISSRRETGGDYRIKTVMPFSLNDIRSGKTNAIESWAERMVLFIQIFSPFLPINGKLTSLVRCFRLLKFSYDDLGNFCQWCQRKDIEQPSPRNWNQEWGRCKAAKEVFDKGGSDKDAIIAASDKDQRLKGFRAEGILSAAKVLCGILNISEQSDYKKWYPDIEKWKPEKFKGEKMVEIDYDPSERTVKMWGSMKHIYDYYEGKGYFFSKEILTRYFLSLKTKPFVILTGISGTGKTKIAQVFAEYMCQDENPEERENRYAFVPVRPDWMDNKGLLGYYNLLDEKYHATPLLRLLLEAKEHPEKPYFVILDEMNLAKVEQYFSDFLSIMESRTSGNIQGEPLDLHAMSDVKTPGGRLVPKRFHIPLNVYFTGTVNVDESTYMFSSKVLDRANVIEFNEMNLESYEKGTVASDSFILKEQNVRRKLLPVEGETSFCSKTDFTAILKEEPSVHEYLSQISGILQLYNLHFGYRVVNEISRYILNAHEMVQNFDLEEAIDIQILQKILPKFHGTQAKLEEPLLELLGFCRDREKGTLDESYTDKAAAYDADALFPRSAQKLARMIRNLKIQGYTSFIE